MKERRRRIDSVGARCEIDDSSRSPSPQSVDLPELLPRRTVGARFCDSGKKGHPGCVLNRMEASHQTSDLNVLYVRPIEPSDRAGLAGLFARLSPESRWRRFLAPKHALSARELTYLSAVDHRWHEALVAIDWRDGSIVGVARYAGLPERPGAADTAVVVLDDLQGIGVGTTLSRLLINRARVNGFDVLVATTLWDNRPARALLRRLGFRTRTSQGSLIELELEL
jgi:RimJ/RimL family protein N-acetyltransferase